MSTSIIPKSATYLGDGLYAWYEFDMIHLGTERETEVHWVGLDPEVYRELLRFAINNKWGGIKP